MENKKGKVGVFFNRFGYYILAFVLILGITLAVALSGGNKKIDDNIPQSEIQTETKAIIFGLPVNSPEVKKWFSDSELMYNETLNQWESHLAVDMVSSNSEDFDVYSVLDGIVTDIKTDYEYGTTITITHESGFVSTYSSLNEDVCVNLNQSVKKGTKLGTVSSTATNEQKSGNHLHFVLQKDGKKVDPANYLTLENK